MEGTPVAEGKKHTQHQVSAPGVGVIDFSTLPEGARTTTIAFKAADGVPSRGVLYQRGGEKTVEMFQAPLPGHGDDAAELREQVASARPEALEEDRSLR